MLASMLRLFRHGAQPQRAAVRTRRRAKHAHAANHTFTPIRMFMSAPRLFRLLLPISRHFFRLPFRFHYCFLRFFHYASLRQRLSLR
jgi:hypothetical protein